MAFIRHLRALWGPSWPVVSVPLVVALVLAGMGGLRSEIVIVLTLVTILAMATPRSKAFLVTAAPGLGIAVGYEAIRYVRPLFVTAERVLGCELREWELRLVSLDGDTTAADYFNVVHTPLLDLVFAIPYVGFWGIAIVYCTALFFINVERANHYLRVLALTHAIAFVIWLAVPAAPPWYIRTFGCEIDIDALPNAAALLRVDQLLGISYFETFYSRAPTVFGALPSLHCAFAAVGLVTAWRDGGWLERSAHIGYTLWMVLASAYLDHHWLLDGMLGIALALLANALIRGLGSWIDYRAPILGAEGAGTMTDRSGRNP